MSAQRNYFLSLLDLDHTSHVFGTRSIEVQDHLKEIQQRLKIVFDKFISLNPTGQIFLFSDHGMVDINKAVKFDIEKYFGKMNQSKYLYFVDSTYARIWIKDNTMEKQIVKYLESRDYGKIVSEEERNIHGLSNKNFGDYIFRANEGVMFVPNFYGGRINKAMHGYDSNLQSQKAIFADITNKNSLSQKPNNSKGIFSFLSELLQ
jgi:predicted AlkP superfamily pyrophosphatase or phosphodiesterase